MSTGDGFNQWQTFFVVTTKLKVSIAFEFEMQNRISGKTMDISKQVTNWVEKKLGNLISDELKNKIQGENSPFDVESYVNDLLNVYFKENEVETLKKEILEDCINCNLNYESDSSAEVENYFNDSLEFEQNEFQTLPTEEIIENLQNNRGEVRFKSLQALEASAEDLVNQTSWDAVKKILQDLLQANRDKRLHVLVLKIFNKLLTCQKPQAVCEGFISLSEVISFHVQMLNSGGGHVSFEEIYDLKERKWLCVESLPGTGRSLNSSSNYQRIIDEEVLIKSMWLLIENQKQMPEKWIRFSQKKLREIIFSFVYLLSSTTTPENDKLSGLELVSVLNPTASWCRHWCHTAVGRFLLCSALRKYRNFFIRMIEIILVNMRIKRAHQLQSINHPDHFSEMTSRTKSDDSKASTQLYADCKIEKENKHLREKYSRNERTKHIRSAPTPIKRASVEEMKDEERSGYAIGNVPRKVVRLALFCHSVSLVVCLVQFRSGRSLFPLQTTSKKRMLTAQDLILSMVDYLENFERTEAEVEGVVFTPAYKRHISEMLTILKSVKKDIRSSRRSTDRLQLSQR